MSTDTACGPYFHWARWSCVGSSDSRHHPVWNWPRLARFLGLNLRPFLSAESRIRFPEQGRIPAVVRIIHDLSQTGCGETPLHSDVLARLVDESVRHGPDQWSYSSELIGSPPELERPAQPPVTVAEMVFGALRSRKSPESIVMCRQFCSAFSGWWSWTRTRAGSRRHPAGR